MRRQLLKATTRPALLETAIAAEKKRRRLISSVCLIKFPSGKRAGLKIEQMLQWLLSQERRTGEPVSRSWEEWAVTLKCHPKTAKRQAMRAFDWGLLMIAGSKTRYGGDAKNRLLKQCTNGLSLDFADEQEDRSAEVCGEDKFFHQAAASVTLARVRRITKETSHRALVGNRMAILDSDEKLSQGAATTAKTPRRSCHRL